MVRARPIDRNEQTRKQAEQLAKRLGGSFRDYRYVEYFHWSGRNWSLKACWERLIEDSWVEVEWVVDPRR